MLYRKHLLLFGAVVLSACSGVEQGATSSTESEVLAESPAADDVVPLAEVDCEFTTPTGFDTTCFNVSVAQDPSVADTETVELQLARVIASETPAGAVPVIYLEGGPGGDALSALEFSFSERWSEIVAQRPVLFYSQRGARFSSQELICEPEVELFREVLPLDVEKEKLYQDQLEAVAECVNEFEESGIDLSLFGTETAAQDLEQVRLALGIDRWHVYGLSYGTRLGQTYARLFPESIDKLVLDSILPADPEIAVSSVPKSAERALTELFKVCGQQEQCNSKYPDLEKRFYDVYADLELEPVTFTTLNPLDGNSYEVRFDGDSFLAVSFGAMYDTRLSGLIPRMVTELESGSTTLASVLAVQDIVSLDFVATSMNVAVLCTDALNFIDQTEFSEGVSNVPAINQALGGQQIDFDSSMQVCDLFGEQTASPEDIAPVESDVPMLALAGTLDPITPPASTELVAEGFSNGTYLEFPNVGHGVQGSTCSNKIIVNFLAGEPLDSECSSEGEINFG